MNFFEHSARVPLIMSGPGIAQRAIANACSLVDLLPTFLEIAGEDADEAELAEPIDGKSLLGLAKGAGDDGAPDEAIGEYCAEMTPYPVFMIRRGGLKYIHCDADPPQLYDLNADPLEKRNLAQDAEYAQAADAFAKEVRERWDSEKLRRDVIETQKSRRLLHAAMEAHIGDSKPEHWDYNPPSDASEQYVRNHMDWTEAAKRYRYPPVKEE